MVRKVILGIYLAAMVLPFASIPAASAQAPADTVKATDDSGTNPRFDPTTITIKVGQTVTFKNTGQAPHTATADDNSWDSTATHALDPPGGSFTTPPFTKAGTVTYKCTYHAAQGMTGTIVVQAGPGGVGPAPSASASATATASASPSAASPSPSITGTGPAALGISPSPTPTAVPSQKYFPKIAGLLLALLIVGVAAGYVKTTRKLADKG
jgi:plastocyanin